MICNDEYGQIFLSYQFAPSRANWWNSPFPSVGTNSEIENSKKTVFFKVISHVWVGDQKNRLRNLRNSISSWYRTGRSDELLFSFQFFWNFITRFFCTYFFKIFITHKILYIVYIFPISISFSFFCVFCIYITTIFGKSKMIFVFGLCFLMGVIGTTGKSGAMWAMPYFVPYKSVNIYTRLISIFF